MCQSEHIGHCHGSSLGKGFQPGTCKTPSVSHPDNTKLDGKLELSLGNGHFGSLYGPLKRAALEGQCVALHGSCSLSFQPSSDHPVRWEADGGRKFHSAQPFYWGFHMGSVRNDTDGTASLFHHIVPSHPFPFNNSVPRSVGRLDKFMHAVGNRGIEGTLTTIRTQSPCSNPEALKSGHWHTQGPQHPFWNTVSIIHQRVKRIIWQN